LKKFYSEPSICENSLKTIHPPLVVAIKPNNWHQELVLESYSSFLISGVFFLKILMADKSVFGEGAFLNKPPLFCGQNYPIWCIRMKFFIQSLHKNSWNAISSNTYVHMPKINESSKEHLDCMHNILLCLL